MTSKAVFYAMEPAAMERYASFKDYISEMSIGLSTEEIKRIKTEIQSAREETRKCFFVDEDGAAHIFVTGPLENAPDPCAIMFNIEMTTYSDIISETRAAEADNNIKEIIYHFDTPGGNVVGLFKTADEIRNTTKKTTAINEGLCASAGYALASQCDEIKGINISVETGSIGVVTEIIDRSGQEEGRGITRYILTSKNAENKAPDVTTEAGRDKIIKRLTDLESVFVEYVAFGRNTTADDILNNFGRGAVLIARDARQVGMIDNIETELDPVTTGTPAAPVTGDANRNATDAKILEGEQNMEMTEQQLEQFGEKIAAKTAATVKAEMTAEMDSRDQARAAETERVAGFTKLKNKYPDMSAMIDDEMGKPEALADLDFAMKVADADKSRIAAAEKQKKDADNSQDDLNPDGSATDAKDESGNILASQMGLKVGGTK
jgi:ClpP class serine protease